MKKIPLHREGKVVAHALVDDQDYESLMRHRWYLSAKGYAVRASTRMHRQILGLERGDPRQGDHVNYNRIDNRRDNLRIVTLHENLAHRRFVGVCRSHNKWRARITIAGKRLELGYFRNRADALAAISAAKGVAP